MGLQGLRSQFTYRKYFQLRNKKYKRKKKALSDKIIEVISVL